MSDTIYAVNPDAQLCWTDKGPLLTNPRARRHVGLDAAAAQAFAQNATGADENTWRSALADGQGHSRTLHPGALGLVADHSGLNPELGDEISGDKLFDVLLSHHLIDDANDRSAYDEFLGPKTGLLDQAHLGSFHENVGQYQTVVKRERNKWRAWHDQKFQPDGKSVNEGPYRSVQEAFLKSFFVADRMQGLSILDFGCGNGYYARIMAGAGAKVSALDTSSHLIEMARDNAEGVDGVDFILADDPADVMAKLRAMDDGSFDGVMMSDVMLLLLRTEATGEEVEGLDDLLNELSRLLRPGGHLYSMEPNPVFWHAARAGDKKRPVAIVPEYRNPVFNVMPSYDAVINRYTDAGLLLETFDHVYYGGEGDPDNVAYASEFPIWDFLIYTKP